MGKISKVYLRTIRNTEAASFESDGAYKIVVSSPNADELVVIEINGNLTGRNAHFEDIEFYSGDPNIKLDFSGTITIVKPAPPATEAILGITYYKLVDDGH